MVLATPGRHGAARANIQRLRDGGRSFARHYTASNDCTPARATLLTGPLHPPDRLHDHRRQHLLDPGFPTWGTMLREQGYRTRWYGKWHLTHGDNHWTPEAGAEALERYGFAGRFLPLARRRRPVRAGGWTRTSKQFAAWFREEGGAEPWCTTVSFVNPHDIAWWYVWSDRVAAEAPRGRPSSAARRRTTRRPNC